MLAVCAIGRTTGHFKVTDRHVNLSLTLDYDGGKSQMITMVDIEKCYRNRTIVSNDDDVDIT